MDDSMQEIIKSIIQIDKNAVNIKENFEVMINERRQLVNKEIEKLRGEIIDGQLKKVQEMRHENTMKTSIEAEKIRQNAIQNSNEMYEKFLRQKDDMVREIFNIIMAI